MYSILQEIERDPNSTKEVLLPSFRELREWRWTEPLIFFYGGGTWPLTMHPWRLCEVSRTFFPVPYDRHWCSNMSSGMQDNSIRKQIVLGSRYDLVGTVFVVERYQAFLLTGEQEQTSSIDTQYNQPVSSTLVRICVNDGETTDSKKTVNSDITKCNGQQLRDMFFRSIVPLLGRSTKQLEREWVNCVVGHSESRAESGGPSSVEGSSQSANEEVSVPPTAFVKSMCHDPLLLQEASAATHAPENEEEKFCNLFFREGKSLSMPRRCANVISLFDQEDRYHLDVTETWARWTDNWDEVRRPAVVNSIDEIVTSLKGSREAAHVAVAYLDAFLSASQEIVRDQTYFSGVLLACAMLGCKQVDRSFPPIHLFLRCLRPESRINEEEFFRYEILVLQTLSYRLHPLTTLEVVETLLELCAEETLQKLSEEQHRRSELSRWGCPRPVRITDRIMDSETVRWGELCKLARFFTDLVLRNAEAHCFRSTTLGFAVFAVAAEKVGWMLPASLADLLPGGIKSSIDGHVHTWHGSCPSEVDRPDAKLLAIFAQMMRIRNGQEDYTTISRAVEFVQECCRESVQNAIDGVLSRRYNIQRGH